jgi:ankyrin repeat-rich membrane spanning protein
MRSQQNSKKYTIGGGGSNNLNSNAPTAALKERIRSETFKGSRLSLRATDRVDSTGGGGGGGITNTSEIGHLFPSFDLFVNINPRTLRRIVNSIALTGRLLRAFEVEFSWWQIYAW